MHITSEELMVSAIGNEVLRLYSFPNENRLSITIQAASDDPVVLVRYPEESEMIIVGRETVVIPDVTLEQLTQLLEKLEGVIRDKFIQ